LCILLFCLLLVTVSWLIDSLEGPVSKLSTDRGKSWPTYDKPLLKRAAIRVVRSILRAKVRPAYSGPQRWALRPH